MRKPDLPISELVGKKRLTFDEKISGCHFSDRFIGKRLEFDEKFWLASACHKWFFLHCSAVNVTVTFLTAKQQKWCLVGP
jgi:hypothetical protein